MRGVRTLHCITSLQPTRANKDEKEIGQGASMAAAASSSDTQAGDMQSSISGVRFTDCLALAAVHLAVTKTRNVALRRCNRTWNALARGYISASIDGQGTGSRRVLLHRYRLAIRTGQGRLRLDRSRLSLSLGWNVCVCVASGPNDRSAQQSFCFIARRPVGLSRECICLPCTFPPKQRPGPKVVSQRGYVHISIPHRICNAYTKHHAQYACPYACACRLPRLGRR